MISHRSAAANGRHFAEPDDVDEGRLVYDWPAVDDRHIGCGLLPELDCDECRAAWERKQREEQRRDDDRDRFRRIESFLRKFAISADDLAAFLAGGQS